MKSFIGIAVILAAGLTACNYPPLKDGRTGADLLGPIAFGENRFPVLGSCRKTFMYSGTCDLIFTDLHDRHIDGFQLSEELDRTVKQIAPLAVWLSGSDRGDSKLPYDLHLLTISPAIVLAVPALPSRTRCSSVYDEGCIQSQGFRGQA